MRLGVYGGTFDPVHFGHLLLAEQCREQCALDEVWFLPAGSPPHKQTLPITPGVPRAEMLEIAIAGHAQFKVDRRELSRSGASYTIDTLTELKSEDPERELFFLMGADSLADLPTWRDPQGIARLAQLVVVNRTESPLPDVEAMRRILGSAVADRVRIVKMPGVDISAHDLRQRVAEGKSIRYMTPRGVESYIAEHRLYKSS